MLILGIILIAVAIIGAFIYVSVSEDSFSPSVLVLLILTLWSMALLIKAAEKKTAIKCLKGNNPYKMEVRYELQDSVFVPVDTVYIKKVALN